MSKTTLLQEAQEQLAEQGWINLDLGNRILVAADKGQISEQDRQTMSDLFEDREVRLWQIMQHVHPQP